MWTIDNTSTRAEHKRCGYTAFACAAVIINDEYETRIHSMHATLDEAKAALAKFVAEENAEETHVDD